MLCVAEAANTTEKISKISIFEVRSDADLIDFNHFGEVVLIDNRWKGEKGADLAPVRRVNGIFSGVKVFGLKVLPVGV